MDVEIGGMLSGKEWKNERMNDGCWGRNEGDRARAPRGFSNTSFVCLRAHDESWYETVKKRRDGVTPAPESARDSVNPQGRFQSCHLETRRKISRLP